MQTKLTDADERRNSRSAEAVLPVKKNGYDKATADRAALVRLKDREPLPETPQAAVPEKAEKSAKLRLTRAEQMRMLPPVSFEVGGGAEWEKRSMAIFRNVCLGCSGAMATGILTERLSLLAAGLTVMLLTAVLLWFATNRPKMNVSEEGLQRGKRAFAWADLTRIHVGDNGLLRVYVKGRDRAHYNVREQNAKRLLIWAQQRGVPVRFSAHCPVSAESLKKGKKKKA